MLSEFHHLAEIFPDSKALYYYHHALELISQDDINNSWNFLNPIAPPEKAIDYLLEASKYARGYASIQRKISQLLALLYGRSNQKKTATLISQSLSYSGLK